jgi:hypothetical protein
MTQPIQPPAPVNAVVTIQPVTSAIPNRESGATPNPLANIANGTTVEGFVVNRDAQNNPILRTAIGDLRVTSDVFLKTGSEVIIKVDNTLASLARILSVDGLTPQDYSAQSARGTLTRDTVSTSALQPLLNPAATQQAGKIAAPATTTPVLQAVILQPQPQAPSLLVSAIAAAQSGPVQALAKLAQQRAGTPIRLTVFDIRLPPLPVALATLPESTKLESLVPARPTTPTAPTPSQNVNITPAVTAPIATPIEELPTAQTGNVATNKTAPAVADATELPTTQAILQKPALKAAVQASIAPVVAEAALIKTVLGTNNPTASYPVVSSPALTNSSNIVEAAKQPASQQQPIAPNQITANVIGHDADGANILHTPFATLKLYTPQPLPTGTTLFVEAQVETNSVVTAGNAPPQDESPLSALTQTTNTVEDVLAWMISNHPDAARELQQRLPNIQQRLASTMLFFMAALKGGGMSDIFGKRSLRLLESGAPELLARLRQEVASMQTAVNDSPFTHWTLYTLPMALGQEINLARLYVGRDPNQSKENENGSIHGQRFVLDIELSQLGSMQFDGFVRDAQRSKLFDLMVRSTVPLEPSIEQGIRAIFASSMAVTAIKGQVIFQHGSQHFVRPMADVKPRNDGDAMHTILA